MNDQKKDTDKVDAAVESADDLVNDLKELEQDAVQRDDMQDREKYEKIRKRTEDIKRELQE
jgi:hypothetical protein